MNKGFTFIELIIYIGIVVIVLLIAVNFAWQIIYGNVKSQAIREVQQNTRFAMEKITRALKDSQDPSIFTVSDNILYQNGVALTTERVKVVNFQITPITNSYKINLTIEHTNPDNLNQYEASLTSETTVSLRPIGAVAEGYCQGTSIACDTFGSEADCNNQGGCFWIPGSCGGTCTPCGDLSRGQCKRQDGCFWSLFFCLGTCTPCNTYTDQVSCEDQLGCFWTNPYCSGTVTPCKNYTTEETCISQDGCQWITP